MFQYRENSDGTSQISHKSDRERMFENSDDGLGWVGAAIGAGSSLLPMITGLFSGCKPGQACGLAGINGFGQQAISTLDQIAQMLQMRMIAPAQAMSEANRVANSLSDSSLVYQAKKGKDAAALAGFKQQAAAKVQQITALAGQRQQAITSGGSAGPAGGLGVISGGGSSLLLLGGLGLVALLALRK